MHNVIKYKFDVFVPRTFKEANDLEFQNGNQKWNEVIEK